jgi:hypothetical protein
VSTPQSDKLGRRIEHLEKALRRWKRGTLAVILVLVLLLGGAGLVAAYSARLQEQAAVAERERAEWNSRRAEEAVQQLLKKQAEQAKEGQK